MTRFLEWFDAIPRVWKAAAAIGTACVGGFGAGFGLAASQFATVPALEAVTERVSVTEADVSVLEVRMDSVDVQVEGLGELLERIDLNSCLTLAEVRGDSNTDRCRR